MSYPSRPRKRRGNEYTQYVHMAGTITSFIVCASSVKAFATGDIMRDLIVGTLLFAAGHLVFAFIWAFVFAAVIGDAPTREARREARRLEQSIKGGDYIG